MARTPRSTGTQDTSVDTGDKTELDTAEGTGIEVVSTEGEVRKMVLASIFVNRPTGKLDKDKHPLVTRHAPPIGKVFAFTNQEYADIMAVNPGALRDPKNEDDGDAMDRVPVATRTLIGASGDAASVAIAAERGDHVIPKPETSTGIQGGHQAEEDEL